MVLDRLPAEEHLDLLIAFARASQGIAPYEEVARSHGLQIIDLGGDPESRIFKRKGFALMFCDEDDYDPRYSRIARLHCVGLFEEQDVQSMELDEDCGVIMVSTRADLRHAYQQLYQKLKEKLGAPIQEDIWKTKYYMEWDLDLDDDPPEEEFAYACWQMPDAILVLLLNSEGDMHSGEYATVDLRIGPLDRQAGLPNSISDPWQTALF